MELINEALRLYDEGVRQVVLTTSSSSFKRRLAKSVWGRPMIMNSGSRKFGQPLEDITGVISIKPVAKQDADTKWFSSVTKAVKMLERSGLWPEVLANLRTALLVGRAKIKLAYEASCVHPEGVANVYPLRLAGVKAVDERLVKVTSEGEVYSTEILWYMAEPLRIKKMYFGTDSAYKIIEIANALASKTVFKTSGESSYDVSYSYDGDSKAWYSEEFRGCGNGHYYLALDESHAMFYEDD